MTRYAPYLPQIFANYPIVVVQHEHLRTSENVVLKLRSEDGQSYALRIRKIISSYQDRILSELRFLHDLREGARVDVPAPVATRSGDLFCTFERDGDEYMCVLFTWVAGSHVGGGEITLEQVAHMARAVSKLHSFAAGYRPPDGFVRPIYDAGWYFGPTCWNTSDDFVKCLRPGDAEFLFGLNNTTRDFLQKYRRSAETFGMIHYDLHVGNFLFHEQGANMIDFDECGFGYYLFDLAHILFEFIDRPDFDAFRKVVAREYTAGNFADRDLDMFLALQGVSYANWLYRIFWRDGNKDALVYWVPKIIQRVESLHL